MKKLFYSALLALAVVACSTDNVEPPALLTPLPNPLYDIKTLWTHSIGGAKPELRVGLGPVTDGTNVYAADYSGTVYAYGLQSGSKLWSTDTKLTLGAGPAINGGVLVVAGTGGAIVSLDPATGKQLWRTELNGEVLSRPAVGSGSVVVRTTDGRLLGLDATSGVQRWKTQYDEPRLILRGACEPVIVERMVLEGLDDGRLVALNLDDGKQLWVSTIGTTTGSDELSRLTDVDGVLGVDGDVVYAVGYHGQAMAVSRVNGQSIWSRDLSSYTGASDDSEDVYVTDLHSAVWSLDKSNGVPVWTQPVLRAHDLTVPVPFGDSLVLGDIQGYLHFLSKKDGSQMARKEVDSTPIQTPPVVVGDTVVVLSTGGELGAYRVTPVQKTGK